jgi:hypothetical protein
MTPNQTIEKENIPPSSNNVGINSDPIMYYNKSESHDVPDEDVI